MFSCPGFGWVFPDQLIIAASDPLSAFTPPPPAITPIERRCPNPMPRTQTTRTNHLGYDVGSSRKIPDGALALARSTTGAEGIETGTPNALMRFALTLFRLLCFGFGVAKAALKAAAAAITTRPADRGGALPPLFQLQVRVDGATIMLDAGSAWTAADVKAALHAKTGRASGGYYLVARGGKPLDDGAATTLAALGVGRGDRLELRGRLRGGVVPRHGAD